MRYNFDQQVDRRGTNSLKWDVESHELPMWVADMDFQTAPEIIDALATRNRFGVFGYENVSPEWYDAYQTWWTNRHHWRLEKDWMLFCTGVVPAISSVVRKMTTVGENVLVLTPVYNIFFNSILNNGRHVLESSLVYDQESHTYDIDYEDLEEKLSYSQTTLLLFCNPHNPVGKIWERETLKRVGELCARYHVTVLSDEIHCDLTDPGCEYIPFASVSKECEQNSITCIAPTKTFNMAGLQTSAIVVPHPNLRAKVERGINTDEVAEPNAFATYAAVAAFTKGGDWLDELREYIYQNKQLVVRFLEQELPELHLSVSQATYLLWIDCKEITDDSEALGDFIRRETGLYLTAGTAYGNTGAGFLRMNIACPRDRVQDGLGRLKQAIGQFKKRR